jgi:hypothetical protein
MAALLLLLGIAIGAAAVYLWARTSLSARDALLTQERTAAEWSERMGAVTGDALTTSQSA